MGTDRRRCATCGEGELRPERRELSVTLPRCRVVASATVPAQRCAACGEVHVDAAVLGRVQLAIGCRLADLGVQTGEVLRHMRKALALRAADLARLLGVTPETVSHWETGKVPLARAAFVAVAAMVGEAIDGRTTTLDRLEVLAGGRPHPRAVRVTLREPEG